jgi:hypothetical protein
MGFLFGLTDMDNKPNIGVFYRQKACNNNAYERVVYYKPKCEPVEIFDKIVFTYKYGCIVKEKIYEIFTK